MKIDLTQYTIEEIKELREQCSNYLESYKDGYAYICKIRSYGRVWFENHENIFMVQELCNQYDGQDGIVDVYSTNPDLSDLHNYGEVYYVESVKDYRKWDEYQYLKTLIEMVEKDYEKWNWNNRDESHFNQRNVFPPSVSEEKLAEYKKDLEEFDMSFTPPRKYNQNEKDN